MAFVKSLQVPPPKAELMLYFMGKSKAALWILPSTFVPLIQFVTTVLLPSQHSPTLYVGLAETL